LQTPDKFISGVKTLETSNVISIKTIIFVMIWLLFYSLV